MKPITLTCFVAAVALGWSLTAGAGTIEGKVTADKSRYVPDTVVYVDGVAGDHAAPADPVEMDQKGSKFLPRILPVIKGTTVKYLNNDPTNHNVYSPDGEKFDLGEWGEGDSKTFTYDTLGAYTQLCKLHPSMLAYVVVLENPYYAVVDKEGAFKIENVPAGKHKLKVWNARRKFEPIDIDTSKDIKDVAVELTR